MVVPLTVVALIFDRFGGTWLGRACDRTVTTIGMSIDVMTLVVKLPPQRPSLVRNRLMARIVEVRTNLVMTF